MENHQEIAINRYFKIPFNYVNLNNYDYNYYAWYVHVYCSEVLREIELHPLKPPVLKLSGFHNALMCNDTSKIRDLLLETKYEIIEAEFNYQWELNGGHESIYLNQQKSNTNLYCKPNKETVKSNIATSSNMIDNRKKQEINDNQLSINNTLWTDNNIDLSKFTYAELRDTINCMNDIELINACYNEIQNRINDNNWKSENNAIIINNQCNIDINKNKKNVNIVPTYDTNWEADWEDEWFSKVHRNINEIFFTNEMEIEGVKKTENVNDQLHKDTPNQVALLKPAIIKEKLAMPEFKNNHCSKNTEEETVPTWNTNWEAEWENDKYSNVRRYINNIHIETRDECEPLQRASSKLNTPNIKQQLKPAIISPKPKPQILIRYSKPVKPHSLNSNSVLGLVKIFENLVK